MQKDLIRTRQLRFTSLLTALLLLLMMMPMSVWATSYTVGDNGLISDVTVVQPDDELNLTRMDKGEYTFVYQIAGIESDYSETIKEQSYKVVSLSKALGDQNPPADKKFTGWGFGASVDGSGATGVFILTAEFDDLYSVTISDISNGSVAADPTSAAANETVTLTAEADNGYALDTISASYETVDKTAATESTTGTTTVAIEVTKGEVGGTYSFTMPAANVTVSATFKAVETSEPAVDTTGSAVDTTGSAVDTTGSAVDTTGSAVDTTGSAVVPGTSEESEVLEYTIKVTKEGTGKVYVNGTEWTKEMTVTGPSTVYVVATPAATKMTYQFATGAVTEFSGKFDLTTAGAYTINVVFEKEETNDDGPTGGSSAPSEPSFPFTDVTEDDWGYDAIYWLWKQGITDGTSSTKYSPNGAVTRAMGAVLLHRAAGKPAAGLSPFIDVPESSYYAKAVGWGYENGCIYGTAPEYYRPARNITREEFAAILYRYMQSQGKGFTGAWMYQIGFADADQISEYAYEAMCWMTQNGVFEGYSDNTVRPQNIITRREAAVMLYRLWNLK